MKRKDSLVAGGDVLNLSVDSTSHYVTDNAKHFDNHGVVFVRGWYETVGDSPYKDYNAANSVRAYVGIANMM